MIEFDPATDEELAEAKDDFVWEDKTRGGSVPKEYVRPTRKGVHEAMQGGVIAGYPVVGLKATLVDGAYHEVDFQRNRLQNCGVNGLERGS